MLVEKPHAFPALDILSHQWFQYHLSLRMLLNFMPLSSLKLHTLHSVHRALYIGLLRILYMR